MTVRLPDTDDAPRERLAPVDATDEAAEALAVPEPAVEPDWLVDSEPDTDSAPMLPLAPVVAVDEAADTEAVPALALMATPVDVIEVAAGVTDAVPAPTFAPVEVTEDAAPGTTT